MKRFKKIYIEVTNICNLHCAFCPQDSRKKETMKIEDFEKVAKEVCKYTDLVALHIKGEPLLHPELDRILDICEKYNLQVNITTNATQFYEKVEILKKAKALRQLNLSIHAINQNEIDKDDYLEKVFNAVDEIKKEREDVYISYRMWEYGKESDNEYIWNRFEEKYKVEDFKENTKSNKWLELDKNVFLNQDVEFKWPEINGKEDASVGTCHGLRNQLGILVDGTVVPCCLDQEGNIALGNIFKNSLKEIIESKRAQDIVIGFENNKIVERLCKNCGYRTRFNKGIKDGIRSKMLNIRQDLNRKYIVEASSNISGKVLSNSKYIGANCIFIYVSKEKEVSTIDIINDAIKREKRVCVPKCENNEIGVYEINSLDDLEIGTFGILEPKDYCKAVSKENIDLAIIPCVSADLKGNRLGHGFGYYDKYLQNMDAYKMGLCFAKMTVNELPVEENDVKLDEIITEET